MGLLLKCVCTWTASIGCWVCVPSHVALSLHFDLFRQVATCGFLTALYKVLSAAQLEGSDELGTCTATEVQPCSCTFKFSESEFNAYKCTGACHLQGAVLQ